MDPLGLWNLWNPVTWGQGGGYSLANSLNPAGSSAHWNAWNTGKYDDSFFAALDGYGFNNVGKSIFGDEYVSFVDLGYYDPCDELNQLSVSYGNVAGGAVIVATGVHLGMNQAVQNAVGYGGATIYYSPEILLELTVVASVFIPHFDKVFVLSQDIIYGITPLPPSNWTQFIVSKIYENVSE